MIRTTAVYEEGGICLLDFAVYGTAVVMILEDSDAMTPPCIACKLFIEQGGLFLSLTPAQI